MDQVAAVEGCPYRQLNPDVMVVQSPEDRPPIVGVGASPWPAIGVFVRHCSNARKSAAHGTDDARQTRSDDQGTRGESAPMNRSA